MTDWPAKTPREMIRHRRLTRDNDPTALFIHGYQDAVAERPKLSRDRAYLRGYEMGGDPTKGPPQVIRHPRGEFILCEDIPGESQPDQDTSCESCAV